MFAGQISKELLSKIYKEVLKLNNKREKKKKPTQLKNDPRLLQTPKKTTDSK